LRPSLDILDPRRRIVTRRFAGTRLFAEAYDRPLRVVHLTDQHFGRVTSLATQLAAVEIVNEQNPDLVALTGDYVAHSLDYLEELEAVLRRINAPKVGVLGNHDHWSGAAGVREALRRADVEVLDNANTSMELRGQSIQIVGVDDAYTGHADVSAAVRGLRKDIPTLALSHIAEEADALWNHGASLVLSGHTHSGQVTLGNLHQWTLGRLGGHRYIHGLYGCRNLQEAQGAVYVSAGIGASVFGLRLGERGRPEVAVFDLGYAPGALDEHHVEQRAWPGRPPTEATLRRRERQLERKLRKQRGR